ncbi:MAG: hypothetical protein HY925_13120 [Elusimicrobia bacterium]|nr:hypothetical protein [Elusimicrobiota bacterium]
MLLELLAAFALAAPKDSGPEAYPRETVADIDAYMPLHCREDVRAAFVKIWSACRRGRDTRECAFRIDRAPLASGGEDVAIVFMGEDDVRDDSEAFRRNVQVVTGKTLAIVHTHPSLSGPGMGPKDDRVPVAVNYVIAGFDGGLWVWDRDLGEPRNALRTGTKWKDACSEYDIESQRRKLRALRDRNASR